MSNLPPKPEFTRPSSSWPDPNDDRRYTHAGRSPPPLPDRYIHARDDRERDRTHRPRYPPRSPPPRSMDSYVASSDAYRDHNSSSSRDYRGYDDYRARDDRRRDWERGHHDRRSSGRVDGDAWVARSEYGLRNERTPVGGRRGYEHAQDEWRGRDYEYRRDRDRDRDRDWARSRDRDYAYEDRRDRYERRESPGFRGEYYGRAHTPPRRPQPPYPPRGRRSTSPRSTGDWSRRSPSPRPRVKTEAIDHPSPGDLPCHAHRSPSPSAKQARYSRSASPRRHTPPVCSQTHPQTKAEPQQVDIKRLSHSDPDVLSPPSARFKDATTDHDSLVPERPRKDEVEPSNSVGSERHKGKVRSEDRKSEVDVVMQSPSPQQGGPRSPLERSRLLVQPHPNAQATASTSPEPSKPAPTLPYLPTIPKYEARPKFSSVYESELSRIEAHRAHAASECKKSWKASRRASHELDMATLDLRAAQHRRELAESHRKRAHHGQLGIEPGVGQ